MSGKYENSIKTNLDVKFKWLKTIQGPIRSFHKMENSISSAASDKKNLLLYVIEHVHL